MVRPGLPNIFERFAEQLFGKGLTRLNVRDSLVFHDSGHGRHRDPLPRRPHVDRNRSEGGASLVPAPSSAGRWLYVLATAVNSAASPIESPPSWPPLEVVMRSSVIYIT